MALALLTVARLGAMRCMQAPRRPYRPSVRPAADLPSSQDRHRTPGRHIEELDGVAAGLRDSGSVGSIQMPALRIVRTTAYERAAMAPGRRPVVILSPGNQTNVAF